MTSTLAIAARELRLAARNGSATAAALMFFVLVVALFPLALQPSPALLRRIAPGILATAALLASLLPLERLFGADAEDGSLDQLRLAGAGAAAIAAGKAAAHFLATTAPLALAAVPLAAMLSLPAAALPTTIGALILAGATFSLLGTLLAALVTGARGGGVLLPLLALPLAAPVLVFATAAIDAASMADGTPATPLLLLGAIAVVAAVLCPLAAGAALDGLG